VELAPFPNRLEPEFFRNRWKAVPFASSVSGIVFTPPAPNESGFRFDLHLMLPLNSSHCVFVFFEMSFGLRVFAFVAKTGKRVQFPRCRATVSEKIAGVHWERFREGRSQISDA
jgi:hypothetical protein